MSVQILTAEASAPVRACAEGLSFWGGVDPASGEIIDTHHPDCGASVAGRILLMPTSRGSCSGSGVLLELALNGRAPAALIFREAESVLTLGALIAAEMFARPIPVARLSPADFAALASAPEASIAKGRIEAPGLSIPLAAPEDALHLTPADRALLAGDDGEAAQLAMRVIAGMARAEGAARLTDVTRAHVDGCILANDANLIFAETMRERGAKPRVPTTINAISVDRERWRAQGTPPDFGLKAQRLADAYVAMGARPTFTCAPYQEDPPGFGERIGWSESNAVVYANSVLGARTAKLPDYLDLFVAMTGRAPETGPYLTENRAPQISLEVDAPKAADDGFWGLLGWLAGKAVPDRIPLIEGVAHLAPSEDDLRALCAAFGATSAASMLHVAGATPEADMPPAADAKRMKITRADIAAGWSRLNQGPEEIDLVALGSPHLSFAELRAFADHLAAPVQTAVIVTLSRATRERAASEGLIDHLTARGVRFAADICWCSITEPVFPPDARTLITNSGKYAHYAPGLSGRAVRYGSLAACAEAAMTGLAPSPPAWL
ncbi:MAG: aconitase family protein [Pseudomonadota bacterium]